MSERFVQDGLEFQRLGQGRLELSAGGSGSVDTLVVGGVDLLPGGAVAFNTSLLQTAIDVADAINVNTSTHGFQASAGTPNANAEIIFYQTVPGLLADSAVTFSVTTITADYIRPTGFADNELFGDTDDFVALPLTTKLVADDFATRGVIRVDPTSTVKQFRELFHKGNTPCVFVKNGVTIGGVETFPMTNVQTGAVSTKPEGFRLFELEAGVLPVADWQKGGFRGVLQCDVDAVFDPVYAVGV